MIVELLKRERSQRYQDSPLMYDPPRLGHQEIDLTKIICYKTKLENTCNNGKNLSEIQLEHEKEDELVVVVVKVVHESRHWMVKEIENELLEEVDVSYVGRKKFRWWYEQDIGGKNEDDNDKKLVMVNEEERMS
nr:hypothetical protein [Tanacetum cinerariifolium]